MTIELPLTLANVRDAAERIAPYVRRTPVMNAASLDEAAGGEMFFKCENLQRVGAFKARGGVNAVFSLADAAAARGVATHSSGNHGAALARAAALRGIPCHVVVPEGVNPVKRAAIARYGATIIDCAPSMTGRETALRDVVEKSGAHIVHPYADTGVMAGQGTVALEFFDQLQDLDVLIVPLGGGGLISGCATGAADAKASFDAGEIRPAPDPQTIADGLRATVGEPNLEIIRSTVDDILTVSDDEIIAAMRLIWERLKIVVEPSAAVGLAAVLGDGWKLNGRRAGIVLTGGNADLDRLPWVTS